MLPGMPNFVSLAKSFGLKGLLIEDREDFESKLEEALTGPGPVLIDVHVRRGENCYPMVPPGKSNAEMIGITVNKD